MLSAYRKTHSEKKQKMGDSQVRIVIFGALLFGFANTLNAAPRPLSLDCTGPTGTDAQAVIAAQRAWTKHLGEAGREKTFPLETAGKVTIEMILLPPGKNYRGEGKGAVVITLTRPLWVGKYEVTQQQYDAVMGNNPSHFKKQGGLSKSPSVN